MNLLTWHIHGSYLYYLSHLPHRIYLPKSDPIRPGYYGRTPGYPWPDNVIEVPEHEVRHLRLDALIYQSRTAYETDRHQLLSPHQQRLPSIYLEHDPPQEHPTNTLHPVQSRDTLLVHVTAFNQLMWDAGPTPTTVIEHGVPIPREPCYTGHFARGVVVINHIRRRGRRLGYDLWLDFRDRLPMDLYGMGWEEAGGVGEASYSELPGVTGRYRFFFNPIRYTSLGLAVCEAMANGMPIVGLATTEMVSAIAPGNAGFVDTNPESLVAPMQELLRNPDLARQLGANARKVAMERFSLRRFIDHWNRALTNVTGKSQTPDLR